MKISGKGGAAPAVLVSVLDAEHWNIFHRLNTIFGWGSEVIIDGVPQGVRFEELSKSLSPEMGKRYIKKISGIRNRILKAKFGNIFSDPEGEICLFKIRKRQLEGILSKLGEKPFEKPSSLWEEHCNNHGVIMPRDDHRMWWIKHFYKVLPFPMMMGTYHQDHTQVLVGLK